MSTNMSRNGIVLLLLSGIVAIASVSADCPHTCWHGWYATQDIFGGRECQHGAEHDNGCKNMCWWLDTKVNPPQIVSFGHMCCETIGQSSSPPDYSQCRIHVDDGDGNPNEWLPIAGSDYPVVNKNSCDGKANPGVPVCSCYSCKADKGCESVIYNWFANCGFQDKQPDGTETCDLPYELPEFPVSLIHFTIPQVLGAGNSCTFQGGAPAGGHAKKYSCPAGVLLNYVNCFGDNCEDQTDQYGVVTRDRSCGTRLFCPTQTIYSLETWEYCN
jgi:hypothetical protein